MVERDIGLCKMSQLGVWLSSTVAHEWPNPVWLMDFPPTGREDPVRSLKGGRENERPWAAVQCRNIEGRNHETFGGSDGCIDSGSNS